MRIALFHNLPSGGAKRTLNEATKRLTVNHQIDVYTLSCANHQFADLRPYVANHRVFDFRPLPLLSSPFGRLNQAIRLADLLRLRFLSQNIARKVEAGNYDVMLVQPCQFEQSPSILRYLKCLPTVYYCHEPLRSMYEVIPTRPYNDNNFTRRSVLNRIDPLPSLYHSVLKHSDQYNTRSANTVLVNSEFMRDAVSQIYQVNAQVSYQGVETQLFRSLPVEKLPMLLSVGSLTPLKGFDFLIKAVAKMPFEQRPALVIASNFQNPPEKEYLQQLANSLEVDLKLLGNVTDERLVELYNQAKITVYSPIREPFGLVPLESMACGTPVVAVREGGTQETILHKQTGLLVERDPIGFAAAVQHLLSCPALSTEYGRNSREHVLRNWSWDQAVVTLENHLSASAGVLQPIQ